VIYFAIWVEMSVSQFPTGRWPLTACSIIEKMGERAVRVGLCRSKDEKYRKMGTESSDLSAKVIHGRSPDNQLSTIVLGILVGNSILTLNHPLVF